MDEISEHAEADLGQLPISLRGQIETELNANETVLWTGRPIPILLVYKTLPMLQFAIPFTTFGVFEIYLTTGFRMPEFNALEDFFSLIGVLFVLTGLGMLAPTLLAMRRGCRTAYVLTTDRAIVIEQIWATRVRSFLPSTWSDIRRTEWPNGSGDLVFPSEARQDIHEDDPMSEHGILGVRHAKAIENLIRRQLAIRAK